VFAGANPITSTAGLSGSLGIVRLNLNQNALQNTDSIGSLETLLFVNLNAGSINDVSGRSDAIQLLDINLSNNDVADFSPLLENEAFGTVGRLWVGGNPCSSSQDDLDELEGRGMTIAGMCN
jgi:hypothetical protein